MINIFYRMDTMRENYVNIKYGDKDITLVKTAHISKNSVEDVINIVNELNPDSICVELDKDRYDSLTNKDAWQENDITKVIKEKKVGFLLVNIILASFQKRMAKNLNNTSGQEMITGIKLAEERNCDLVLADRSIKNTFTRIWNKLGFKEKAKLIYTIIFSIFDDEDISEEDLEELKKGDALEAAIADIGKDFPIVKKVLVDERDQYLAYKIKNAPGNKIVAVIGAAHAPGIIRNINKDYSIEELDDTSHKKGFGSIVKWLIPIAIVGMVIFTLLNNQEVGINQIKSWLLWNGSLSALGVLIALGHPLSIITAFIAAPITSLNPLLAAGWFAGLVEAMIRKPKVKDFENLANDTATIKGFWHNRVTHILLVVIMANIFSSLGTIISGLDIFKSFISTL